MAQFVHPSAEAITLTGVLGALSDPMRLRMVRSMLSQKGCMSCMEAMPCPNMAKSTLSNHFRVLREAGIIRTVKQGVEHRNTVRVEELNERFPGLLKLIIKLS